MVLRESRGGYDTPSRLNLYPPFSKGGPSPSTCRLTPAKPPEGAFATVTKLIGRIKQTHWGLSTNTHAATGLFPSAANIKGPTCV